MPRPDWAFCGAIAIGPALDHGHNHLIFKAFSGPMRQWKWGGYKVKGKEKFVMTLTLVLGFWQGEGWDGWGLSSSSSKSVGAGLALPGRDESRPYIISANLTISEF